MSAGTNTAGTLGHDANAGRYKAALIPQYTPGADIGTYLLNLGKALQAAEAAKARTDRDIQRAFQVLNVGSTEATVLKDVTSDGTNFVRVYIPVRVFAIGATNTSNISGTNCT